MARDVDTQQVGLGADGRQIIQDAPGKPWVYYDTGLPYDPAIQQYNGQNVWGSAGAPTGYSPQVVGPNVTINGTDWTRVGNSSISEAERIYGKVTYDPTYGYVVPSSKIKEISDRENADRDFFSKALDNGAGPLIALAALTGGAASGLYGGGAAAGGTGATGLTEGAALASEAGFLPGSFPIGASGYGGTAAAGLDAAAASASGIGGAGTGALDFANSGFNIMDPSTYYGQGADATIPQYNPGALEANIAPGNYINPALNEAYLGAPYQAGFNLFDPSTYGSAAGALGAAGAAGAGAGGTPGAATAATAGGNALSRLLSGESSLADIASLLGTLGATGLGVLGANKQADAYEDISNQWMALGAPSRARYEASFQPGFSVFDDSATRDAATQAADVAARSYSARAGNPFDSPGSQSGIYDSVLRGVALPQLNTYRSQNLTGGQLGTNTAGTASLTGAGQSSTLYDALGGGLGLLTQPEPQGLEQLFKKYNLNLGRGLA